MIKRGGSLHNMTRILFLSLGTLFLGVGIIGIFIPILPTTPFLLLAAACYARGSKTWYDWLLRNKWFGTYIDNYRKGKGIPWKVKIVTLLFLWATIIWSAFYVVAIFWMRIVLIVIAIVVTLHILTIKTFRKNNKDNRYK